MSHSDATTCLFFCSLSRLLKVKSAAKKTFRRMLNLDSTTQGSTSQSATDDELLALCSGKFTAGIPECYRLNFCPQTRCSCLDTGLFREMLHHRYQINFLVSPVLYGTMPNTALYCCRNAQIKSR